MLDLYPPIEPHASGMLDVGDGNLIYWEAVGNPDGTPLVYLHGKAKKRAEVLGMGQPEVSLSHSDTLAFAFVVAPVQDETDYDEEKSLLIERLVRRGLL